LDKRVKSIANSKDMPRGSQYLITAQEQLSQEGLVPKADDKDPGGLRETYIAATKGDAKQQSALALAYVQRKDERTPFNPKRAEYWSRESALQGNPVGQMGYGIILYQLDDKVNGYRWVEFAASNGADIGNNLNRFRMKMNEAQLLAVQR
jgi:TPR repeat protein